MITLIGWLATLAFALSGIPFALAAIKTRKTDIPWSGITLILAGSLGMFIYEYGTSQKAPQLVDFGLNAICWLAVAYVKLCQHIRENVL